MFVTGLQSVPSTGNSPADAGALAAKPVPRVDTPAILGSEPQVSPDTNGPATRAAVEAAVAAVKDRIRTNASNLEFRIDDESGETVVRVKDAETNEVIRQYPSEEMLVIARNLARLEHVLVDKKA